MARHVGLLVICLVTVGVACSGDSGPDWFPLAEDMRWEYALQLTRPYKASASGLLTSQVTGVEYIDGEDYLTVATYFTGLRIREPRIDHYRKTSDGIYQVRESRRGAGEFLAYPLTLEVGRTWQVQSAGMDLLYRVEGIESVPLPTRTYDDCLKISFEGTLDGVDLDGTTYLAPDVGMVYQVEHGPDLKAEILLMRYSPGT